jgi:hypothetical protein
MGGGGGQTKDPTSRGRFTTPLPPGPEQDENSYCFKLPWKMIIEEVEAAAINNTDYTAAADPANVKWELTAWYNVNRADDLITGTPEATYTCVNVTDTMPNDANLFTAQASDGGLCHHYQNKFHCCMNQMAAGSSFDINVCNGFDNMTACNAAGCLWGGGECLVDVCRGNLNSDRNVDATDVGLFLNDFGRSVFSNPCPCF